MSRIVAVALVIAGSITALGAQQPNESVRVSTFTAKVERIERSTRGLVVMSPDGLFHAVTVDPSIALYDELAEGDAIVVDYIDAVVASVKPRASMTTLVEDTTASAQAAASDPSIRIDQQLRAVVTIEAIDLTARTVVYHGKDNRRVLRAVQDPALLRNIRAGDIVEITMTRAKAVSITRAPQ